MEATTCIWCGKRIDSAEDGSAFLFLANRDDAFTSSPESWLDKSPRAEGHQFYCHLACFKASVPAERQYGLLLALGELE